MTGDGLADRLREGTRSSHRRAERTGIMGRLLHGALVGGNLTLISTTMGTPYEIDTRGRILLLEDVEPRRDRNAGAVERLDLPQEHDQVAARDAAREERLPRGTGRNIRLPFSA